MDELEKLWAQFSEEEQKEWLEMMAAQIAIKKRKKRACNW